MLNLNRMDLKFDSAWLFANKSGNAETPCHFPVLMLLFPLVFVFLTSCNAGKKVAAPAGLEGRYLGKMEAKVRFKKGLGDFVFVRSGKEIPCVVTILKDGEVSGNLGDARFEGCCLFANRNAFERLLNFATEVKICGQLNGNIFPGDTIRSREISIPFYQINDSLSGSVFQKNGLDLFPISGFELKKTDSY